MGESNLLLENKFPFLSYFSGFFKKVSSFLVPLQWIVKKIFLISIPTSVDFEKTLLISILTSVDCKKIFLISIPTSVDCKKNTPHFYSHFSGTENTDQCHDALKWNKY